MIEISYRCADSASGRGAPAKEPEPQRRAVNIKLAAEGGKSVTCLTTLLKEGVVRFPLFLACGVPLSHTAELAIYFEPQMAPEEFEIRSVKLVRLPVAAGKGSVKGGSPLVVDLSGTRELVAKSPFFPCGVWAYVPRRSGGVILTRAALAGDDKYRFIFENAVDETPSPEPAVVACYAFDHGFWAVGTTRVPMAKNGPTEVSFSLQDIGK